MMNAHCVALVMMTANQRYAVAKPAWWKTRVAYTQKTTLVILNKRG